MIPEKFKNTIQLYGEYEAIVLKKPNGVFITDIELFNGKKPKGKWHDELTESFLKEYKHYSNTNTYFIGCSLECYQTNYLPRLKEYLQEFNEALEIDFVLKEYNEIKKQKIFEFIPITLKESIGLSYRRQLEFLNEKASILGFDIYKVKDDSPIYDYRKKESDTKTEPPLDLSESSLTEKIIYLELLGILDFIKENPEWGTSINRLATLVSAITGGKSETIQSYINPINNPSVGQKNNPMNKEESVQAIKSKLIDLGFSIK